MALSSLPVAVLPLMEFPKTYQEQGTIKSPLNVPQPLISPAFVFH